MIAMALANEPDLLIADEPTTALDVTIQAQILDLLLKLKSEFNMAMLLITHDLGIVRKMADRVCVMTNGEIVERGTTRDIFASPQHPYTKHLLASEPKGSPPAAERQGADDPRSQGFARVVPDQARLHAAHVGHIKAVDGIDLEVKEGQTLGVVGESGSGKTTLGLALLRLVSSEGPIIYLGNRIDGYDLKRMRPLRRDMQIVFQDPYGSLSPRLSVAQIIEEGLLIQKPDMDRAERRARVSKALKEVGLDPASQDRYPHEFSGGQRQRIAIARALVLEPKFLILDEPTSRSTCRCRRRSSISCATSRSATSSLISSSATTSKWCARSPTPSSCSVTARWWSKVRRAPSSPSRRPTTPRRCSPPPSSSNRRGAAPSRRSYGTSPPFLRF